MGLLTFDIQAHRGGAALAPENTLAAFGNALDIGVTTLECDVHVSADGVPVLSHERTYAGRIIPLLTWAELSALDPAGPEPIAALVDLLSLVTERGADEVGLNIETKFDIVHPDENAPRERFVESVLGVLDGSAALERASIQSFDWAVLRMVHAAEPRLALNALANTDTLEVDEPGSSPWLDGLDIDAFADSIPAAVSALGFDAISPSHTILTPAMVAQAHEAELRVLPYTVDNEPMMRHLIAIEVDGLITNRPDLLREVLASIGQPLPRRHPPHG
ncbi:MAG: glycerophosphodiester phosphodiesterase family protein [Marmoricola sp.]